VGGGKKKKWRAIFRREGLGGTRVLGGRDKINLQGKGNESGKSLERRSAKGWEKPVSLIGWGPKKPQNGRHLNGSIPKEPGLSSWTYMG